MSPKPGAASHVILRAMSDGQASQSTSEPRIWGVCGGSGSGKSTLVGMLVSQLPPGAITVVHFDAYYRDLSHLAAEERVTMNFDHPDSLESELLIEHVETLVRGGRAAMPHYDFAHHSRSPGNTLLEPAPVVLVEGILLFAFPRLASLFDYRVFIDVPEPVRLERRTARDVVTRGRSESSVRAQFAATVAPMHWEFVQPGIELADRVVRYGEDYEEVAQEFATQVEPLLGAWEARGG
ncbi:MAG: uridine kinase [Deltaproteobacteria bacterium]|nr:uridine kinase [Deltaproteobacteria bacterium]